VIIAIYRNGGDDLDVRDMTDRLDLSAANVTLTENAEELTVGSSTMVLDDPLGDWNIAGHAYVRVTETEADDTIVWAGFATIREISRGEYGPTEAARQWALTLDDVNTVIARRILTDSEWNRPAETDVERIQALFDADFLGPDDSFFSTDSPVDLDAADCRGMTVYDVVNDCMQQSGKNSYQQDIEDGTPPDPYGSDGYTGTTWYDFAASEARSSDLQISNYLDDITAQVGDFSPPGPAQTWEASLDTKCRRDPTRIYWKIVGNYDGGQVIRTRLATAAQFAARETTASWPLVKTAAQAAARADRMLLDISTEEDVITTTILVHPDHINDARAGHRIQARFSHLPGYEDWTWMRILNRTAKLVTPRVWAITYTLSPGSIATPSGTCATALGGASSYDSGRITTSGADWHTPASQVVTLAPSDASVLIAVMGFIENSFQPGPFVSTDSPWVILGPGTENLHVAAYKPNTTSGGTLTANYTGGDIRYQALVAVAIATDAVAPVQTGYQAGSGGIITLGAPPTEGNIMVLCSALLGGTVGTPGGWASVVSDNSLVVFDGIHGISLNIAVRCAGAGEGTTIAVPDDARAHWSYISEWTP